MQIVHHFLTVHHISRGVSITFFFRGKAGVRIVEDSTVKSVLSKLPAVLDCNEQYTKTWILKVFIYPNVNHGCGLHLHINYNVYTINYEWHINIIVTFMVEVCFTVNLMIKVEELEVTLYFKYETETKVNLLFPNSTQKYFHQIVCLYLL